MATHVLSELRQLDPRHAEQAGLILGLLNDPKNGLVARLAEGGIADDPRHWADCSGGLFLHVNRVAGRACIFDEARLDDLAKALDQAEPLLAHVETRLARALDPQLIVGSLPEGSQLFDIGTADQAHRILLALAPDAVIDAGLHAATEPDWSRVPCRYEVRVSAAALAIDTASRIAAGDLLLIGRAAVAARIDWPAPGERPVPSSTISGRLNLASGLFIMNDKGLAMSTDGNSPSSSAAPGGAASEFTVPLTIRLPDRVTSVAELSAMHPGTTLNVGAVTQGIQLSVQVGNQEIARGQLVQVADQFAVLIEETTVLAPVEKADS